MYFLAFILLLLQWLVFSGRFDAFHITLGVIASAFVAYTSRNLLFRDNRTFSMRWKEFCKFPSYLLWLGGQIVIANFYLMKLVFSRNMKNYLQPQIVTLNVENLKSDVAKVTLAHSITLTPGTISLSLENKTLTVYAINSEVAKGLDAMLKKVTWVFAGEML